MAFGRRSTATPRVVPGHPGWQQHKPPPPSLGWCTCPPGVLAGAEALCPRQGRIHLRLQLMVCSLSFSADHGHVFPCPKHPANQLGVSWAASLRPHLAPGAAVPPHITGAAGWVSTHMKWKWNLSPLPSSPYFVRSSSGPCSPRSASRHPRPWRPNTRFLKPAGKAPQMDEEPVSYGPGASCTSFLRPLGVWLPVSVPSALPGNPCPPRDHRPSGDTASDLSETPLYSQEHPCPPREPSALPGNPIRPDTPASSQRFHHPPRDLPFPSRLGRRSRPLGAVPLSQVQGPWMEGGQTPRRRPRLGPQTHLGHVTVLLPNGSGVELLGRDQAQPQGLRSRAKASGVASPSAHCLYTPLCPMVSAPLPPVPPVLLTLPLPVGTHPKATTAATTPSPLSNVLEPSMRAPWSPLGWTVHPGEQRQREVGSGRAGGVIGRHPGPETPPAAEAPGDAGASWPLRAPGAGPKTASSSIQF